MSKFRIYNRILCPELWDRYLKLDPRVRVNLLRMAYDFYEKTKFPAKIIDVYFMGSAANYNWSPNSDIDVHVIINYNQLQMPADTAAKAVKTAGAQWNMEHNVIVKGHKVELNIQNASEQKPHVTGIYSLVKDQWIRTPSLQLPQVNKQLVQVQFMGMKKYIDTVISSGNREAMKAAKTYIDAYRQYGLDTQGELSNENIVFKALRSRGLIKKLRDAINVTYDKEMSVQEGGFTNTIPHGSTPYLIVGITNVSGETTSGVTTSGGYGHGNLFVTNPNSTAFIGQKVYWRYRPRNNTLYLDMGSAFGDEVPSVLNHLKEKYGITDPIISKNPEEYLMMGHQLQEDGISKNHFTLDPPDKNGVVGINLDGKRFGQSYLVPKGWGRFEGKWVFNKSGMAIDMKHPGIEKGFDRPEDILPELEKWYAPLSESHIDWAAWEREHNKDVDSIPIPGTNMRMAAKKQMPPQNLKIRSQMLGFGGTPGDPRHSEPRKLPEVREKDIKQTLPSSEINFEFSNLTMDNLKALREKAVRMWSYCQALGKFAWAERAKKDYIKFDTELKRRIKYINSPVDEGYGAGDPNTDRLKIKHKGEPVRRWQIRSKDAPKTPKMPTEELLTESPKMETLKKNRKQLDDNERQLVMAKKAVWHNGPKGEESPAVWKAIVDGKTWYVTNTHRAYQCKPTIKGAINAFHSFIKSTA